MLVNEVVVGNPFLLSHSTNLDRPAEGFDSVRIYIPFPAQLDLKLTCLQVVGVPGGVLNYEG